MLGQMEAVLKLSEEQALEIKKLIEEQKFLLGRIRFLTTGIKDLWQINCEMKEVLNKQKSNVWLSSPELCKKLGISINTLRNYKNAGLIKGHQPSGKSKGRILYDLEEVSLQIKQIELKRETLIDATSTQNVIRENRSAS